MYHPNLSKDKIPNSFRVLDFLFYIFIMAWIRLANNLKQLFKLIFNRVTQGNFTPAFSRNRAWKSPFTRLFIVLNHLNIYIYGCTSNQCKNKSGFSLCFVLRYRTDVFLYNPFSHFSSRSLSCRHTFWRSLFLNLW